MTSDLKMIAEYTSFAQKDIFSVVEVIVIVVVYKAFRPNHNFPSIHYGFGLRLFIQLMIPVMKQLLNLWDASHPPENAFV